MDRILGTHRKITEAGRKVASWKLYRRTNLTLDDLAKVVNPVVGGWLAYFAVFYPSAVVPLCKRIDEIMVRWAMKKYKRLRRHKKRAREWLVGVRRRAPLLFAHWRLRFRPDNWTARAG